MRANTSLIPRQADHFVQVAETTHALCKLYDSSPALQHHDHELRRTSLTLILEQT